MCITEDGRLPERLHVTVTLGIGELLPHSWGIGRYVAPSPLLSATDLDNVGKVGRYLVTKHPLGSILQ